MKRFCLSVTAVLYLVLQTTMASAATAGFSIQLIYNNTPTTAEEEAFNNAKATWESIITGYRDTVTDTNVEIEVNLAPIDGEYNVLGSAGPRDIFREAEQNFAYVRNGEMTFDTSDTARLANEGSLTDVILHEMGHVLGIGTLWNTTSYFSGTQDLYNAGSGQFTGESALAAYKNEFDADATFVPVELGGGGGTANAHWNEVDNGSGDTGLVSNISGRDFRYELMTGWLNAPTFISSVTIQSLFDIGYIVQAIEDEGPAVPEPSTFALLGIGVIGLIGYRRKTQQAA